MWLSKVSIPESVGTYQVHQYLWGLFDHNENDTRPFLFVNHNKTVTMLSTVKPGFEHKALDVSGLINGACVPFSLVYNPTKRNIATGKQEPIFDFNQRRTWLNKRLIGAKLNYLNCSPRLEKISFNGVVFYQDSADGILQITDRDAFLRFLIHGVGRSKAFGCGLIYLPEVM